jgi:hypothetical protein
VSTRFVYKTAQNRVFPPVSDFLALLADGFTPHFYSKSVHAGGFLNGYERFCERFLG